MPFRLGAGDFIRTPALQAPDAICARLIETFTTRAARRHGRKPPLVDELLRVRFMPDAAETGADEKTVELLLLERQAEAEDRDWFVRYAEDHYFDEDLEEG